MEHQTVNFNYDEVFYTPNTPNSEPILMYRPLSYHLRSRQIDKITYITYKERKKECFI